MTYPWNLTKTTDLLGCATVVIFVVTLSSGSANAQINGPAPDLMGQGSSHLYSVPGVIAFGNLQTFFACTNVSSANVRVGVELFDASPFLTTTQAQHRWTCLPV